MAERTKYAPGTFSWTDLTTTDQDGAKPFYGELFGWDAVDNRSATAWSYSMMQHRRQARRGISPQSETQREAGAPPAGTRT